MTALHPIHAPAVPNSLRLAPALYGATLFLSALLLFAVQPMFTKMVLPRLGGAPTVWSVAMVFFQAALLGGYAYAHLLVRRLPLGLGALVHLGVLAVAAATLPIAIAQGFGTPPTAAIAPWLIALFAASIGLPFVALAASAPLLQGWFAASGHVQARNPYVLYAASNLGSFAALIAYPFVIEPFLTLREQAQLWSAGFAMLALLVAVAALPVARRPSFEARNASAVAAPAASRFFWAALAAIPVGLVIAVTSYITTDIASAPFLWVLPLALYLLTFVAVFRDPPWLRQETVAGLVPFPIAILAVSLLSGERQFWLVAVVVNLVGLRAACAALPRRALSPPAGAGLAHRVLSVDVARRRHWRRVRRPGRPADVHAGLRVPDPDRGRAPGSTRDVRTAIASRILTEAAPVLGLAVLAVLARSVLDIRLPAAAVYGFQIVLRRPCRRHVAAAPTAARFLALVVLGFVLTGLWQPGFNRIAAVRSFFGVHQIIETADGRFRLLYHGTTVHGAERIADTAAGAVPEPLTYYYRGGPISESIEAVRAARGALPRVAVVGLGSGTLSCYRHRDEQWTFFEIDPAIEQIARDPRLFTYISACAPDLPIVLGDARLTLAASRQRYDLIILDAFSSDVVPVHLLTREAIDGYLARLEDGGALVLHLSNRYMELGGVIAAVAGAQGLVAVFKDDDRTLTVPLDYKANASVAVLARRRADLGELPSRPGWRERKADPDIRIWTDDYSNVLGAILRKRSER